MTVHTDRAHHHPRVHKQQGHWFATCPRCGTLVIEGLPHHLVTYSWKLAMIAALAHASESIA